MNFWRILITWIASHTCHASNRTYNIFLKLGGSTGAQTKGIIWFRIQGSAYNSWTHWFSQNNTFTTADASYSWNETLNDVGNVTRILVLSRQHDGMLLAEIGVDGKVYELTPDIWIDYNYGKFIIYV